MIASNPTVCDYLAGVGSCTQSWRGCGAYLEPRCVTEGDDEDPRVRAEIARMISAPTVPDTGDSAE